MDAKHKRHTFLIIAELLAGRQPCDDVLTWLRMSIQDMIDSLEIPVDVVIEAANGTNERLLIGDVVMPLTVLPGESTRCFLLDQLWRYARWFVTEDVTKTVWQHWNPTQKELTEDRNFVANFQNMLMEGVSLGVRLGRFREITREISADGQDALWHSLFEEAIAGQVVGKFYLHLSREYYQSFIEPSRESQLGDTWEQMLAMMTDGLFYELGVVFPPIEILMDASLAAPWFRCEWNDLKLPEHKGLEANQVLVNDTPDRLILLNISGIPARNPANGSECAIIDLAFANLCETAGLTTWDAPGYMILSMSAMIRRAAAAFVNESLIELFCHRLGEIYPLLVSEVQEKIGSSVLARILRGLSAEEISLRDFSSILNAILSLHAMYDVEADRSMVPTFHHAGASFTLESGDAQALTPAHYIEFVRWSLRHHIFHKHARDGKYIVVYLLDPAMEDRLGKVTDLTGEEKQEFMDAIRAELGLLPPTAKIPVMVTPAYTRQRLRRELSPEFWHISVLSYHELSPGMNIQPFGQLSPTMNIQSIGRIGYPSR